VENSEGDGSFANSAGTNESNRSEAFCETSDLLNPLVTPKEDPWWRWRGFSGYAKCKYQILDPLVVKITDMV
jgi:hypothetical protein